MNRIAKKKGNARQRNGCELTHGDTGQRKADGDDSICSEHGAGTLHRGPRVDKGRESVEQEILGQHLQNEDLGRIGGEGVAVIFKMCCR